jgi:hypothetical protein
LSSAGGLRVWRLFENDPDDRLSERAGKIGQGYLLTPGIVFSAVIYSVHRFDPTAFVCTGLILLLRCCVRLMLPFFKKYRLLNRILIRFFQSYFYFSI